MALADDCGIRHVAIIMDGNGRWAKTRGLNRLEGHKKGSDSVKRIIQAAKDFGLEYLTLYAFSTENWKRSKDEVDGLMGLLCSFVDEHIEEIVEKGLRVIAIGRLDGLPPKVQSKISEAMEKTSSNKGGTVILALNYGGRAEIVDAARRLAVKAAKGEIEAEAIDESVFASNLYAPGVPDPDLMIRTSGEMRLSNFLLWELSYSEFYVTDVLWPDFDESSLREAMESFKGRGRRFGGVKC
jgi:undecaprenyl diphosphate synthase